MASEFGPLQEDGLPHPKAWSAECPRCIYPYPPGIGRAKLVRGRRVNRAAPQGRGGVYSWCQQCEHVFKPVRRDKRIPLRPADLVP